MPSSALVELKLFNTRTRLIESFVPMKKGEVGLYTCGPTVYSYAHIGNMRSYIFADTLRRTLEYFGYRVNHVMNITDVGHLTDDADAGEDKLELGAKREGLDAWAVARKYTDAFFSHAEKLHILRPSFVCKATDYIAQQIAMVQALENKGFTYKTSDGVYFDTSRFPRYGDLARLDIEGLQEGHRVEQGEKRNKTDFALWKLSKPEEKRAMEWDSPWGRGFPGWHIECSAMSTELLGPQFDIHTGGVDHIPIHHTNEVAQSECATGKSPFVNVWMHGEFLVEGESLKMSKSKGKTLTVDTLEANGIPAPAYRLLCLQTHYRKQLKYTNESQEAALKCYERLTGQVARLVAEAGPPGDLSRLSQKAETYKAEFDHAMANDLGTPVAVASLLTLASDETVAPNERLALIRSHDRVLALDPFHPVRLVEKIPDEYLQMLAERNRQRAAKNWAESDRLRDALLKAGYEILDAPEGSSLKKRR